MEIARGQPTWKPLKPHRRQRATPPHIRWKERKGHDGILWKGSLGSALPPPRCVAIGPRCVTTHTAWGPPDLRPTQLHGAPGGHRVPPFTQRSRCSCPAPAPPRPVPPHPTPPPESRRLHTVPEGNVDCHGCQIYGSSRREGDWFAGFTGSAEGLRGLREVGTALRGDVGCRLQGLRLWHGDCGMLAVAQSGEGEGGGADFDDRQDSRPPGDASPAARMPAPPLLPPASQRSTWQRYKKQRCARRRGAQARGRRLANMAPASREPVRSGLGREGGRAVELPEPPRVSWGSRRPLPNTAKRPTWKTLDKSPGIFQSAFFSLHRGIVSHIVTGLDFHLLVK
ncbi:unnamed protein product [Lampetra planeri]